MITLHYFSAQWCAPCKVTKPVVQQVAAENPDKLYLNLIDVDADKSSTSKYGVRSVPTFVFEKNGTVVHRKSGGMSKGELQNLIDRL